MTSILEHNLAVLTGHNELFVEVLHGQLMREHLELERSQAMLMLHNSIIERQVHNNQQLYCSYCRPSLLTRVDRLSL